MLKLVIRLVLALAILVAAVFISGQLVQNGPRQSAEEEPAPAISVDVVPVEVSAWQPEADWTGQVVARDRVSINAPRATEVDAVHVQAGDRIDVGDPLVSLDTDGWERDRESALADREEVRLNREQTERQHETQRDTLSLDREMLAQAQRALERERGLQERGASTQTSLEQAENQVLQRRQAVLQSASAVARQENELAALDLQEARVQRTLDRLDEEAPRLNPEAPFRGRIEEVNVSASQQVAAGTSLVSLYAGDALMWRVGLPAGADNVEARLAGEWVGMQQVLASTGESTRRQGEFPLPEAVAWVPGETRSARVRWPAVPDTQIIPSDALFDGDRVYVVGADNRLQAVPVRQVGVTNLDGTTWLIIDASGLPDDGRILATRIPDVLAGIEVTVDRTLSLPAAPEAR